MTGCFVRFMAAPDAKRALFCLPHAGGRASAYRSWAAHAKPDIEILAAALPGRGMRARDAPAETFADLVSSFVPAIHAGRQRSFALFGHSMGAWLAFELARSLKRQGLPAPVHLFLSAMPAPTPGRITVANGDGDRLAARLQELQGTPAGVLRHPDAMEALLPAIRSDLALLDTHCWSDLTLLDCPVTVLGGLSDPIVDRAALSQWKAWTTAAFSMRLFRGGHFYMSESLPSVLSLIHSSLGL